MEVILAEILGNLRDMDYSDKRVEKVAVEWFELDKRFLRKTTDQGRDVGINIESCNRLQQGDVLYINGPNIIVVELSKTEAIVFEPQTMKEMALICYQLGNRHAPIFLEENQVLTPLDQTIVSFFNKLNIPVRVERRRLEHVLHPAPSHAH